ncbi:MAG: DUF4292 domain-containing protein [Bacteroidales bacterium]
MKKSVNSHSFIVFLFATLLLSGCKLWRKTADEVQDPQARQVQFLLDTTMANNIQYQYLDAKIAGEATLLGGSNRFKGTMRMQKDSVIWISLSPGFGFEVARVLMTPDSLMFLNRLNKTFLKEDYKALRELVGFEIPFSALQNLLIGNLPEMGSALNWQADTLNGMHTLKEKMQAKSNQVYELPLEQKFFIAPDIFRIRQIIVNINKPQNRQVIFEYVGKLETEQNDFPKRIFGTIKQEDTKTFEFTYKNVSFEKKQQFPFSVGSNYKQLQVKNMPR